MEKQFEFLDVMRRFRTVDLDFMYSGLPRSEIKIIIQLGQLGRKAVPAENHYQMSELAELMNVSGPAISKSIKHLEGEGFLCRLNDPHDRRKSRLDLTDKGWKLYQTIEKNLSTVLSDIYAEMGADRFELFLSLLEEFVEYSEKELDKKKKAATKKSRKAKA